MKCPYCGNNVREIDEICDRCGRRMSEIGAGNRTCLSCGKMYDWYSAKCPHCGAETVSTTISESRRPVKRLPFLFWDYEISPDSEEGFVRVTGHFWNKGIRMSMSRNQFKARMLASCIALTFFALFLFYCATLVRSDFTWVFVVPGTIHLALLMWTIVYWHWALS